jgi:hypothetical protein
MVVERPQAILDNCDPQLVTSNSTLLNLNQINTNRSESVNKSKNWLFKFFK